MSDPDPQQLIEQLAEEACISLFEAYGVTLAPGHPIDPLTLDRALTGIVGFTGNGITGMCLLVCAEAPLLASMPTEGSLRDWSAEMSNQLAGRIKHKLLPHGVEVYITTPIVLRAARIEPMPKRKLLPIGFRGPGGAIGIWIEVETSHDFRFAPGEVPVAEGETLLFE
ncbi:MAG: hypothetical protein ABW352_05055 [Polyangiales bacterium]